MRAIAALQAMLIVFLFACGPDRVDPPDSARSAETGSTPSSPPPASAAAGAETATSQTTGDEVELVADRESSGSKKRARRANERPLPAFGGPTLDGSRLSISSVIGKRLLLFFFNPDEASVGKVADAVAEVAKQQQSHNFRTIGIGIGSKTSSVRSFASEHGLDFPIIDDSSASITNRLGLRGTVLVLGTDAEGYVTFALQGFDTRGDDAEQKIATRLRESMRIPTLPHAGALLVRPKALPFTTEYIDGKPFDLADLEGKPKIVMFFLHTCPHCHHALEFFKEELAKIPEAERPALVAISVQNRPSAVRLSLDQAGLDFFTPLVDPGQETADLYGVSGGVPDILMIDADDEVVYRMQGWREDRDPALMRMYLHRIAGRKVPMLLSRRGYAGNDVCTACHEQEAATWELTRHAQAFDTLVTHGEERDGECVSCHVVGYDQPGGYSFSNPAAHLEDVGCETCHGRGGPHLSPDHLSDGGYAAVCGTCHDAKHSLGFDFATFLPGISHKAIAALSDDERAERFAEGLSHRDLLPASADYVGSDACQSCHAAEFATWASSPHGHAVESLARKGKADDANCQRCHTTGYGREGGFPAGGDVADHTDLARVGCESCHGPGGNHVGEGVRRLGTITSLGDKCDSCVILQICGSCHDAENDDDFEFSVQEHIDRQRHGTIEPGTGKPLGASAHRLGPPSDAARIARAIRQLDAANGSDG